MPTIEFDDIESKEVLSGLLGLTMKLAYDRMWLQGLAQGTTIEEMQSDEVRLMIASHAVDYAAEYCSSAKLSAHFAGNRDAWIKLLSGYKPPHLKLV